MFILRKTQLPRLRDREIHETIVNGGFLDEGEKRISGIVLGEWSRMMAGARETK